MKKLSAEAFQKRISAIINAREFLIELLDPKKTPRVPKGIRYRAYALLKHYPGEWDLAVKRALKIFRKPQD
jgi:hypothetical protein